MSGRRDRSSWFRAGAWALFGVMAVLRAVIMLAPLSWRAEIVLSDALTYLTPMAAVVVLGTFLGARGRKMTPAERVFWRLLACAVSAVLVSEVYWTWYAVAIDVKGTPLVSWVRVLHAFAVSLIFILLVRMTRFGLLSPLKRVTLYLDVLSGMVIVWPFVFVVWTYPFLGNLSGVGVGGAAVAAVYPVFGAAMMLVTGVITFASVGRDRPLWERLTAASLWLYGLSLCLTPLFFPSTPVTPATGSGVLTMLFGFGFVLLLVAMVYRLTAGEAMSPEPWPLPRMLSMRSLQYYPVITASALPLMGWFALWGSTKPVGGILLAAVWALCLLLATRSWVAAVERARIRARVVADPAAGVLTRGLLDRRLLEVVEYSGEAGREASIIVFDARATHPLTDLGGLPGTDEMAATLVRVVRAEMSEDQAVFRVAGERFAVILEDAGPAQAAETALGVWVAAGQEPGIAGAPAAAGVCAGIASFPLHALAADRLLAAAEVAVSAAHGVEGEPVVVFDPDISPVPAAEHRRAERLRVQRSTVRALAEAVDARDPVTKDHSTSVADLATALARFLDLPDHLVQVVGLGALMHDVGKIGVCDDVLLKGGLLDAEERVAVEQHTILGERILAPAKLDEILPGVRWHHERWDGTGYPDGLKGEDIPIEARILAVCDAFETITTGRPYRAMLSLDQALKEIAACAGTQFDPGVAAAFVRMVRGLSAHRARESRGD